MLSYPATSMVKGFDPGFFPTSLNTSNASEIFLNLKHSLTIMSKAVWINPLESWRGVSINHDSLKCPSLLCLPVLKLYLYKHITSRGNHLELSIKQGLVQLHSFCFPPSIEKPIHKMPHSTVPLSTKHETPLSTHRKGPFNSSKRSIGLTQIQEP